MSWSASYIWNGNKQTEISVHLQTELPVESKAQADVAFDASAALILSGAVGSPEKKYKVMLSGHANPGNEPNPGWSNDSLTINIYQLGEEA